MYRFREVLSCLVGGIASAVSVLCSPAVPASGAGEVPQPVKIGVLAQRGSERCLAKWGPTAEYLTSRIPGNAFTIAPLGYDDIYPAVERKEVDFILANPSLYVGMERLYGASRILTLKNLRLGGVYTVYGGVIFFRSDRKDIASLSDLAGKTFMAVEETSLGGWRAAWLELTAHGIDPYRDFADLRFGATHDAVVYAVREGKVDAGAIRTDTLERMAMEGRIDLDGFRVFAHNQSGKAPCDFPFSHSTALYPEWPLAKAEHTSDDLAEKVTAALLGMSADSPAARAARCAGWTIPHNYEPVHACLKALRVGPYEGYGKVTPREVLRQYWPWLAGAVVAAAVVVLFAAYVVRLNRRIREAAAQQKIELVERVRAEEDKMTLQEQLHQAQKMEAVGQLAGGVAHDFKDLLAAIFGFTGLARTALPRGHEAVDLLKGVEQAAEQAAGVTNSLMTFSRRVAAAKEPVDLREPVEKTVHLLRRVLPKWINVVLDAPGDSPVCVCADSAQVQQVVMNLAINARDAMPQGGTLRISVSTAPNDGSEPAARAGASAPAPETFCPQPVARLVVSDTGLGMAPDVRDRIFEPFFTTKPQGQSTGLGLSIVHAIVKDHDGRIDVESALGKGSTFTVTLPCVASESAQDAVVSPETAQKGGGELILLVEDDHHVRAIIAMALQSLGYKVAQAEHGSAALRRYREHCGDIRLLLVDAGLLEPGVPDCLKQIRREGSLTPAIVFVGDGVPDREKPDDQTIFLRKPFDMPELAEQVGRMLRTFAARESPS